MHGWYGLTIPSRSLSQILSTTTENDLRIIGFIHHVQTDSL